MTENKFDKKDNLSLSKNPSRSRRREPDVAPGCGWGKVGVGRAGGSVCSSPNFLPFHYRRLAVSVIRPHLSRHPAAQRTRVIQNVFLPFLPTRQPQAAARPRHVPNIRRTLMIVLASCRKPEPRGSPPVERKRIEFVRLVGIFSGVLFFICPLLLARLILVRLFAHRMGRVRIHPEHGGKPPSDSVLKPGKKSGTNPGPVLCLFRYV